MSLNDRARRIRWAGFVLAGVLGADGVHAQTPLGFQVEELLRSESYVSFLKTAIPNHEPAPLAAECKDLKPLSRRRVEIITPLEFELGTIQPRAGQWIDHLIVDRCGEKVFRRIYFHVAKDKAIQARALVPGTTYIRPILEPHIVKDTVSAGAKRLDCTEGVVVIDATPVSKPSSDRNNETPWEENWTVAGCGKRTVVTVVFTPKKSEKGNEMNIRIKPVS
jgi:hypothetical protein